MTEPLSDHDHDHDHDRAGPDSPHGGHGLMMIACCIPMLVIAVALVATGVVSTGFLLLAVGCTVMMVLMMRMMMGGVDANERRRVDRMPKDR